MVKYHKCSVQSRSVPLSPSMHVCVFMCVHVRVCVCAHMRTHMHICACKYCSSRCVPKRQGMATKTGHGHKDGARLQRRHGPHSSTLVVICVVQLLFVLSYVLSVCKCVLPPGDNPTAVNKYINYIN